ncbi:hypothetical protein CCS01_19645 [Rhodopila globiformis]|uniref:Uncharacterized protein n=2 Tax=Rhodopila globiformis TaxID=1071 RepID=A0A2S6N6X7_RHOGL|nr:hypothetical protein CCS01_19645 [Rhodopila globiformis]
MLHRNMTSDDRTSPEDLLPVPSVPAEDPPSPPPRVYREPGMNDWIVEPPGNRDSPEGRMVFKGERAQHEALTYAHEKFGNARFFPY